MARLTGEFTATVPAPIVAAPGLLNLMNSHRSPSLAMCIDKSEILVQIEEQTEPVFDEYGDVVVLPEIRSFKVWITREVSLELNSEEHEIVSTDDEGKFEEVLVEAIRRVVSAIKQRTGQPSIDTRHPVHSYGYKYHRADETVNTMLPLQEGMHRRPEYAWGVISFDNPCGELDENMWETIRADVASPVEIPIYDELLHDAVMLRSSMQYQLAALSAAIAIELMLWEICSRLLERQGNLQETQIHVLLQGRRPGDLIKIIRKLDPDISISSKEVQSVSEERNRIAHGKSRYTDADRMADILHISNKVRKVLSCLIDTQ